jgi:hypothetical protein
MNKLTKKEQEFLLDWLSDDLHIELEKEKSEILLQEVYCLKSS